MSSSIDRLKRKAKALRKAVRAEEPAALARVAAVLKDRGEISHADALHVIAREEGHESWPRLKVAMELAGMDRSALAERLKYALYLGQDAVVRQILTRHPDVAHLNFGLEFSAEKEFKTNSAGVKATATFSAEYGHNWSWTTDNTRESSEGVSRSLAEESVDYTTDSASRTEITSRGEITLGMKLLNASDSLSLL